MNDVMEYLKGIDWAYLGARALIALIILVAVWIVAGWAGRLCKLALHRLNAAEALVRFGGKAVRILIVILGLMAVLSYFGIQTTGLAAVLGGSVLAIGLAFQGSLSNVAAGVMLLIFRPFKIGDYINAAGQSGTVNNLGLFTTDMDTPDNRRIIVPNSAIFGSIIENYSFHDVRRADIAVGVDYAADIDKTRDVLERVIETIPERIQDDSRKHQVVLTNLGASSVDWAVRIWCQSGDYWAVKEKSLRAAKMALDEAGIGIPFPQLSLHVEKLPK